MHGVEMFPLAFLRGGSFIRKSSDARPSMRVGIELFAEKLPTRGGILASGPNLVELEADLVFEFAQFGDGILESCTHGEYNQQGALYRRISMATLYTFARSSTAWRVRIVLNLKSLTPNYKYVHLFRGEQKMPSYQAINPNMGVPSYILPDGNVLIESMAIIEYLDEVHPQPHHLFRGDPVQRAKIRGFCEVVNSGIHPYQNLRLLQKLQKQYKVDKNKWLNEWLVRGAGVIEKMVEKSAGKYVFGDTLSAADAFFYPQIKNTRNRFKVDIKPFPSICRVLENLESLPEFRDSEPEKQLDFE